MNGKILSILKYGTGLLVAGSLLWYVFKDWNLEETLNNFLLVNYFWILVSVVLSIISHIIRAYRWNLLLHPLGHRPKTYHTFLAVMIGYLANLAAPRAGEITRCGVLKGTDSVKMTASFGSVVAERIIDFLCLLTIICLGLILEFDRLSGFLITFFTEKAELLQFSISGALFSIIFGLIVVASVLFFLSYREYKRQSRLYEKVLTKLKDLFSGLTSVLKLENKTGFWVSTISIWVLYYAMAYVVIFSLEATENLGLGAGLSILIMGGLGMSAPVQGGLGTYHLFVGSILVLYGVSLEDGYFFATLIHASQTLTVIVVGSISFILMLPIKRHNKELKKEVVPNH